MRTTDIGQQAGTPAQRTAAQNGNSAVTGQIKLVEAAMDYQEPLVISTYGGPGSGKSRLAGTAPGAIGLIPTERKSRQTVLRTAAEFGRKVIVPEIDLIRTDNPMLLGMMAQSCVVVGDDKHKNWTPGQIQDEMQRLSALIKLDSARPSCCQRHYFRWHVQRVKSVAFRMADDPSIRTIVIDTFGALVDDISYANYGITGVIDPKEFGFAPREDMNKEVREFLNCISHKNLVLTHHSSDVWKDGKPTNQTKPMSAFSKIGHYTSVMLEQVRNDKVAGDGAGRYVCRVKDCQANASIIGLDLLMDEDVSFATLAQQVYPESDPGFWT